MEVDYGKDTNMQVYGQDTPPEVHTNKIAESGIPIGVYIAKHDKIILPEDAKYSYEVLKELVVDYMEIDGGHLTFMFGKDMSYFKVNVLNQIEKFNPLRV